MKKPISLGALMAPVAAILLSLLVVATSFRSMPDNPAGMNGLSEEKNRDTPKEGGKEELGWGIFPTGSSLPDCSNACGPCFPCKRVMVSFQCSIAESCPIVYRCMCKGRYYHVPSN